MKKIKRSAFIATAMIFALFILLSFAACGKSGFEGVADYITEKGTESPNGNYRALTIKNDGIDYSAMYYADDVQLIFGIRKAGDVDVDSLMLLVNQDTEISSLMFTRQNRGESQPYYAATGNILVSDPVCKKLLITIGDNQGAEDSSMLTNVNSYINVLIDGVDAYIFAESGLLMSDLGFKY